MVIQYMESFSVNYIIAINAELVAVYFNGKLQSIFIFYVLRKQRYEKSIFAYRINNNLF